DDGAGAGRRVTAERDHPAADGEVDSAVDSELSARLHPDRACTADRVGGDPVGAFREVEPAAGGRVARREDGGGIVGSSVASRWPVERAHLVAELARKSPRGRAGPG